MMVTEIQGWVCCNCLEAHRTEEQAAFCCRNTRPSTLWVCDACQTPHGYRTDAENCAPACQKCQHCGTPRDQWPKGDA